MRLDLRAGVRVRTPVQIPQRLVDRERHPAAPVVEPAAERHELHHRLPLEVAINRKQPALRHARVQIGP